MRSLLILSLIICMGTGYVYAQQNRVPVQKQDSASQAMVARINAIQRLLIKENRDSLNAANRLNALRDVGYGYQKSSQITGSVSSVKTDGLRTSGYSNIYDYLQGRVPGLTIVHDPSNSSGYTLRIRGIHSFNGSSEPLIVLNGTPLSSSDYLQSVNPSDIKSIDVLKDAASSAIYGVRGANGVILIRTY